MPIFEEVRLSWGGKDYVIPPNDILRAIAKVEEVMTLGDLGNAQGQGRIPYAKLASAFGVLLRHAGATVTDEDVYNDIFKGGPKEMAKASLACIGTLMSLMIPPEHLRAKPAKKAAVGVPRAASSKRRTSS